MKFNVTTRLDGIQAVRKRMEVIKRAPQIVLEQTAQEEVAAAKNRIQSTKVDPDGRPWAPWSMRTLMQRSRDGSSGRGLLNKSGALLNSIMSRISGKTLTIFSNLGYGNFLQFGTPRMPARPFLGWSQASINKIRDRLKGAVNDK